MKKRTRRLLDAARALDAAAANTGADPFEKPWSVPAEEIFALNEALEAFEGVR